MASFFPFFGRRKAADMSGAPHEGYFPLTESRLPEFDDWDDDQHQVRTGRAEKSGRISREEEWDRRLGEVDRRVEQEERARQRWWQPVYWRGRKKRWWIVRAVAGVLFTFILLVGWLAVTAPLNKSLEPIVPPQLTLLAADGTPIARNGAIVAAPVKLAELPKQVVQPFLAIEDRRFYSHWGIDPRGIARAALTGVGGGSTITQQLAKFTFLSSDRTLTRKGQEVLIAFWLEAWLSKDQILERYLSNAYFGDNVYGLRAASLHYFYRKPEKLRPEQAMMLAGLVQAPSRYAPTRHFDAARKRMELVKRAMVAAGYMTQAEVDALPVPQVDSRTRNDLPTGTYFADWALPEARKLAGNDYSSQTLTTTLDARLQGIARQVTARAPLGKAQVALVAMRRNGEVVAMIGGKDYGSSPFNRATQARRQPGSTFKLFVYLAALEAGMRPEDLIDNRAIETGGYRPRNASETYSDTITLKDAFARSSNVATVRLFNRVGDAAVIKVARDLGITAPLAEGDPSLALGTSSVTLLELTAAYAGVAANRFPVTPHAIAEEEPGWFDWMFDRHRSLSDSDHAAIEQLLGAVVQGGTGRAARLSVPSFGKTGTSQDNRDALFVGYAGDLVVGVWVGNDDNTPLKGVNGGGLPARIWADFMRRALGAKTPAAPRPKADPAGPVEPLDLPGNTDIPLGDANTRLRIDKDQGATLSTEVQGIPVDIRIDRNGLDVRPGPSASPSPAPVATGAAGN